MKFSCGKLEWHAQEPGLSPQHWRKQSVMRENINRNLKRDERRKRCTAYTLQVLHCSLFISPHKSTVKHYHDGNRKESLKKHPLRAKGKGRQGRGIGHRNWLTVWRRTLKLCYCLLSFVLLSLFYCSWARVLLCSLCWTQTLLFSYLNLWVLPSTTFFIPCRFLICLSLYWNACLNSVKCCYQKRKVNTNLHTSPSIYKGVLFASYAYTKVTQSL